MNDFEKATTYGDFISDVDDLTTQTGYKDYKLVLWDGSTLVPLVIEGIDHEKKCIVLADVERFNGACEDMMEVLKVQNEDTAEVHRRIEMHRRMMLDNDGAIETMQDAREYMADVLARGPLEDY